MRTYIAYFDYLGFKEFILKNDSDHLRKRANHLLRDVEDALTQGRYREPRNGVVVPDLEKSGINCLTISDTVVYWTRDDSEESRQQILAVAHRFNWRNLYFNMPVRGVVCYDELDIINGDHVNAEGFLYSPHLIYGKGLVNAHIKAESLNWAGCVIDQSVVDCIVASGENAETELNPYAKLYDVPYKDGNFLNEYAMNLADGPINTTAFTTGSDNIRKRFAGDNKPVNDPRVQEKLENTINFLASFREENQEA